MNIGSILILVVIFVLLGLAVLFISENGGWKGGCSGNCATCHSRCSTPKPTEQPKKQDEQ